jgi:hypothetical protein
MPSNLAVANAITKIGYGDIHEQLDDYLIALKKVESGSQKLTFGGVQAQFAVHVGRNQGIGSLNEFDDLPDAGQNKDAIASLFLKYQYGRVQGTGQVFKQVQSAPEAFVDWMKREVDTIKDSLQRDLNRQVYGDGTGTIATLTSAPSGGSTFTVDDSHWLEEDMTVDVLTQATLANTTPTKGNTALLTIVSVDPSTNTITVSGGTVTATTGSVVVRARNTNNNWKKEWEGLGLIVSTTSTLHGINPAVTSKWKAGYVASSVGTLTELAMTRLVQGISQKGGNVTDFLTTYGVANAYWNTLQGLRRYDGGDGLKGGATTPVFQSVNGNIPFTLDWAAPAGTIHAINTKEMFLHQEADWAWMDMTGSMWQQVPNKDAYSATMFKYSNIGVTRRNSFGKLTGITEL